MHKIDEILFLSGSKHILGANVLNKQRSSTIFKAQEFFKDTFEFIQLLYTLKTRVQNSEELEKYINSIRPCNLWRLTIPNNWIP